MTTRTRGVRGLNHDGLWYQTPCCQRVFGTEIWGCSAKLWAFFQFWLGLYCGTKYARVQKWDPNLGSYPHVSPGRLKVTFRVQRLRFRV